MNNNAKCQPTSIFIPKHKSLIDPMENKVKSFTYIHYTGISSKLLQAMIRPPHSAVTPEDVTP